MASLTTLVNAAIVLATAASAVESLTGGDKPNIRSSSARRRTRDGIRLTNPNRAQGNYDPYRQHSVEDKTRTNDYENDPFSSHGGGPASVPDLTDLLDDHTGDVVGDVSWMLDFSIVGNAKCGTTFLAHYINYGTDLTDMPKTEVCKLSHDAPGELVQLLYDNRLKAMEEEERHNEVRRAEEQEEQPQQEESEQEHQQLGSRPSNLPVRHGLKCPKELGTEHALRNYATYFPATDFIVTTRHPVLWFQSFYNYRFGNWPVDDKPPHPSELVGPCLDDGSPYLCGRRCAELTYKENVCTDRAKFHHQLARFGKTPMDDPKELLLLRGNGMDSVPVKGRVFLMELGQLFPGTKSAETLPQDLTDFLRLGGGKDGQPALPEIVAKKHHPPKEGDLPPPHDIDICEEQYAEIRALLVEIGADASEWIREYFLESGDVVVPSREEFLDLIEDWSLDPCEDRVEMRRVLEVQSMFDM